MSCLQGSELDILKSVNWKSTKFDVITVNVNLDLRPYAFSSKVGAYIETKGYYNATGIINGYQCMQILLNLSFVSVCISLVGCVFSILVSCIMSE